MKTKIIMLLLILPQFIIAIENPDAAGIMEKCRELSILGSMSADLSLTITEKNGAVRRRLISMTSRSYDNGQEKRMIRFIEPADVRGTSMLIIDNRDIQDEMWIYLPALKKTRRIVSSEKGKSFMSSEFTNADMSTPAASDFKHRHLANSGSNGQWIIESIPAGEDKADEYGYSKKISYIDPDSWQVRKMEFFNFDNQLFKTVEIKSVFQFKDGKYMVKDMVAANNLTGRKSEILFSNLKEGIEVDESVFTLRNLEK